VVTRTPMASETVPVTDASTASLSDAALVSEYRTTGSEQAFRLIVARHGAMVFRSCLRQVRNHHEAEDAAQAVFLLLAQRPHVVRSSLPVWLHWAARNMAFRMVRSQTRRKAHESAAAQARTTLGNSTSHEPLREELDAALARLPVPLRLAVILRYLEGHSQEEAARLAGIPRGTLGRRAMEGLARLRSTLQRRGIILSMPLLLEQLAQEAIAGLPAMSLVPFKLAAVQFGFANPVAAALADGLAHLIFWSRVKLAGAATVLALLLVGMPLLAARLLSPAVSGDVRGTVPDPLPSAVPSMPKEPIAGAVVSDWAAAAGGRSPIVALLRGRDRFSGITLYDLSTGKENATLPGQAGPFDRVHWAPEGPTLATVGGESTVRLWNGHTGRQSQVLHGHKGKITALAFAPTGRLLTTGSARGEVLLWDSDTGKRKRVFTSVGREVVTALAISPDNVFVAAGTRSGSVHLWNIVKTPGSWGLTQLRVGDPKNVRATAVNLLHFSPDSKMLALSLERAGVGLLEVSTGKLRALLPLAEAKEAAFIRGKGDRLAVICGEGGPHYIWYPGVGKMKPLVDPTDHPYFDFTTQSSPDRRELTVRCAGKERTFR
jgi:RNA polymerase sigma factor (sigma-70 family)